MENDMEEYLISILEDMHLYSKKEGLICTHGSRKDDELEYTTYYDVHRGVWTTYTKAVEGYILNKLKPMINKIIKEN